MKFIEKGGFKGDDDLVVDEEQMDKFTDLVAVCLKLAKECDAEIKPIDLTPDTVHRICIVIKDVGWVNKDNIPLLCSVLQHANAINFEIVGDNTLEIWINIPDVYRKPGHDF